MINEKKVQAQAETLSEVGLTNFIEDMKSEFKKVSWTDKEELKSYTQIVVGATFVFGFSVFFMDVLIQTALQLLSFVLKLVVG